MKLPLASVVADPENPPFKLTALICTFASPSPAPFGWSVTLPAIEPIAWISVNDKDWELFAGIVILWVWG